MKKIDALLRKLKKDMQGSKKMPISGGVARTGGAASPKDPSSKDIRAGSSSASSSSKAGGMRKAASLRNERERERCADPLNLEICGLRVSFAQSHPCLQHTVSESRGVSPRQGAENERWPQRAFLVQSECLSLSLAPPVKQRIPVRTYKCFIYHSVHV